MESQKVKLKDVLKDGECYTENLSELLGELNEEAEVEEDGTVNLSLDTFVKFLQITWDKVKETAWECEGKRIQVKLPNNWAGRAIGFAFLAVGFRL